MRFYVSKMKPFIHHQIDDQQKLQKKIIRNPKSSIPTQEIATLLFFTVNSPNSLSAEFVCISGNDLSWEWTLNYPNCLYKQIAKLSFSSVCVRAIATNSHVWTSKHEERHTYLWIRTMNAIRTICVFPQYFCSVFFLLISCFAQMFRMHWLNINMR